MDLKDFLPKNPKNVVIVTSARQVDDSKPNVKFVGSNWCGYSQLGAIQFNRVCDDVENAKCYLFDLENEGAARAARDLGIVPEGGIPDNVIVDKNGKKETVKGMLPAPQLRELLSRHGFKFRE